jgi:hypothetical protein
MRVDGRDRGGHRDHGFDGITALDQDVATGSDRAGMGRSDDGMTMSGGVQIHEVLPESPYIGHAAAGKLALDPLPGFDDSPARYA